METKIVCFADIHKFYDLRQNSEIEIKEVGHSSLIQHDVFGLTVNQQ